MPKSSKTSHVLSLLVNDLDPEDTVAASQLPQAEPAHSKPVHSEPAHSEAAHSEPPPSRKKTRAPSKTPKAERHTASAPEKPPRFEEEAIAQNIRNALEEALEKEAEHSASEPRPAAKAPANIKPSAKSKPPQPRSFAPASFEPSPEESAFVPVPASAFQPTGAPEPPGPRPSAINPPIPEDGEPFCFNVMQALVEAKASRYIGQFGLCSCPRCRTDVIALALSRLPSKYVVATQSELASLLPVYEDKYNAAVAFQLMRACNRIAEKPRHMRE